MEESKGSLDGGSDHVFVGAPEGYIGEEI